MKKFLCAALLLTTFCGGQAIAQVDIEHRRTVLVQTSAGLNGEEKLGGFGFYWFNENNYPWTNTALRVIFAGIYLGAELSYFLPACTNTAIGIGAGGGMFIDGVTPYFNGERPSALSFDGDAVEAHVFINQTIPNPTPLPLNLRATYSVSGSFYRDAEAGFVLPEDILTQSVLAEFRFGGIEPGLASLRGAELYLAADANYRTGFSRFGPTGALYPGDSEYQRLLGLLSAKLPAGPVTVFGRLAGGTGNNLDQLSAWKIGGNLVGVESWSYPVHGYYTREFLAADFGLANLELIVPISKKHGVRGHFYADWAVLKQVPPAQQDWDNIFGIGVGVGFRAPWGINTLLTYGYGFNAVRDGDRGGHELALALEKSF
jgi:hypothetical protein